MSAAAPAGLTAAPSNSTPGAAAVAATAAAAGAQGPSAVKSGGESGAPASPPRSALATLVDQALKLPCVGLERLQDPDKRLKLVQKLEAAAAGACSGLQRS